MMKTEQPVAAPVKTKRVTIRLVCLECGHKWSVSPNACDPQCRKCNSVDCEVA